MITTLYEPFRHWSEGGSVFILSDTHFDDADCKLMDPGWITPEEQLKIINSIVGKCDTFVCLGDVGDPKYVPMIKARKKILLLGNHDARGAYKDLFDEIYSGPLFISDKILLSHEPVYGLPWCLNIHGHDHSGMEAYREGCKHINLAANVCGYTPVNLGKLIKGGVLADIDSIHRMTIDRAVEKSASGKTQEFDYGKYIWQIQFCLCNIAHNEIEYSTTIDYVRRKVTDCKTNTNTHTTDKRVYDLEDDESFDELLSISVIAKLHEFEELSEQELKGRICGYRDGWRLKYSYFTHEAPPRIDGSLGTVYDDSPFEKIFEWIIERAPYDIYGL